MSELDEIFGRIEDAVSANLAAAGDFMVSQLRAALPRAVKHRGKDAPIADRVRWYVPGSGGGKSKRRSRASSQLPLTGAFAPGSFGETTAKIDRIVVEVPWPWLPNEVGHRVGYRMATSPVGRRKRVARALHTGFVGPNPIVRKTFDRCEAAIAAILTSGLEASKAA